MRSNENTTEAYAAGIFDGEGCVMISRQRNTFFLSVRVTSTDRPILDWLLNNFGGLVNVQTPNKHVKTCRPCWYWAIHSRSASIFLSRIAPFSVIKKDQIELALEFQSRIGPRGVNRLEDSEITTRETYKRRLSELKLGVAPETREGLFDPAYVAGLIDGEGTILIYRVGDYYQLSVRVTNTDIGTLERMKSLFGGDIGTKKELVSKRTRPCWTWQIQGPKAAELLVELFPYFIIKRAQVQLALEFQTKKHALQQEGVVKAELVQLGEEYKMKISQENRRVKTTV